MIQERSSRKKPLVRVLFLGNPVTDRRVKNFIGLFLELGFDVEFIFAAPGKWEIGLEIEGVRMTRLMLDYSGGAKMFLQYDKLLKKELEASEPCDILFTCELYSLRAASELKKEKKSKQLIYDARELYSELPSVAANPFKKWYWKRWERKGLAQTDLVIVTAPDDADAIKHVHNILLQCVVIRNLPIREKLIPNNYLRDYFSIPAEKKIFVYVGGLQKDRGLGKVISVMASFAKRADLILIGEGPLQSDLAREVIRLGLQKNVFFHPAINSEKIIEVLTSADLGISLIEQHSKSYELALPSKIFEYMHAGLPVISSPLKQVKDLFHSTEGVVFADPDDSAEISVAFEKAMVISADPNIRNRIRERMAKGYTFETDTGNLKSFLRRYTKPETRTSNQ
ncbi:MAG: glycosyltransferase [Candidatus Kapaibacterium sp.]